MDDALVVDYMVEKLGIDKSKIPDLCNLLYKNYGTTMAGLRVWIWLIKKFYHWNNLSIPINYVLWDSLFAGNWLWFWLWWISQVWKFLFFGFFLSPFLFTCWSLVVLILKDCHLLLCLCALYKGDWPFAFICNSFVHGRLPYENLKSDPVLRSRLLSLPYRKVVSNWLTKWVP